MTEPSREDLLEAKVKDLEAKHAALQQEVATNNECMLTLTRTLRNVLNVMAGDIKYLKEHTSDRMQPNPLKDIIASLGRSRTKCIMCHPIDGAFGVFCSLHQPKSEEVKADTAPVMHCGLSICQWCNRSTDYGRQYCHACASRGRGQELDPRHRPRTPHSTSLVDPSDYDL